MENKQRIYIVAKISGLPEHEVRMKYENAKIILQNFGYIPVAPIDYIPGDCDWHKAMRGCIRLMLSCDCYTCIDATHTAAGGMIEDTIGQWVNMPRIQFSKL